MKYLLTIIFILILLLVYELYFGYKRHLNRTKIFNLAKKRAQQLNKKLIVVGDAHNGVGSNLYKQFAGYGYEVSDNDILIDIEPCDICKNKSNTLQGDLKDVLKKFDNDSAVIYISCTLEYIKNIDPYIKEIFRVCGNFDNLFINHIQPYTLSAYIYNSKVYNVIYEAPPESNKIVYTQIN